MGPNGVESKTGAIDSFEGFPLRLETPLVGPTREGVRRQVPMVRSLRLLQRLERNRMLVLPVEPAGHALGRDRVGIASALHAEALTGLGALSSSDPTPVARHRVDAIAQIANDDLLRHLFRHGSSQLTEALRPGQLQE
jgi:hypothetical protein